MYNKKKHHYYDTFIVPNHIAIIMDGNGRWAIKNNLPRIAGHTKGVDAVKKTIKNCMKFGVKYLTLFAFSLENLGRPENEILFLMNLFKSVLEKEFYKLSINGICFNVIGDTSILDKDTQHLIKDIQKKTKNNNRLILTIAINYSGKWDIIQAIKKIIAKISNKIYEKSYINEEIISQNLSISYAPEPDLFIRTGGEQRISNFLLWHLSYTELYFTNIFWPDFGKKALESAIFSFSKRERKFGKIPDSN